MGKCFGWLGVVGGKWALFWMGGVGGKMFWVGGGEGGKIFGGGGGGGGGGGHYFVGGVIGGVECGWVGVNGGWCTV